MPHYFFHFLHHHQRIEDEEGLDLPRADSGVVFSVVGLRVTMKSLDACVADGAGKKPRLQQDGF